MSSMEPPCSAGSRRRNVCNFSSRSVLLLVKTILNGFEINFEKFFEKIHTSSNLTPLVKSLRIIIKVGLIVGNVSKIVIYSEILFI